MNKTQFCFCWCSYFSAFFPNNKPAFALISKGEVTQVSAFISVQIDAEYIPRILLYTAKSTGLPTSQAYVLFILKDVLIFFYKYI